MSVNDGLILDIFKKMSKHMEDGNLIFRKLYPLIQQLQAENSPKDLTPYMILLNVTDAYPLEPRNDRRQGLSIYNMGPGDLLWGNQHFHASSILQQISDPNFPNTLLPAQNQKVMIGLIPSGASLSIPGTSSIWAHNIGGTCTLSIAETSFATPKSNPSIPGLDGVIGQGYAANGQKVLT